MNRSAPLFALLAILPAALHAAPVMAGDSLLVPICTGDGQVHTVQVPVDGRPGSSRSPRVAPRRAGGESRIA